MKRFNRTQRRLLTAILVILTAGSVMMALRQAPVSNAGYSAWAYIRYGLVDRPLTSLGNMFRDVAGLWSVYQDNVYLNEELASQRSYQTMYQDEKNRNEELQEMLEMKGSLPESLQVSCNVLTRPASAWDQSFTISAGSMQGVRENMLAASSEGVVGLVSHVETATSTVELLTSDTLVNDIAISIPLEDGTTVEGILQSYDAQKQAYRVSLFNNEAVITSGQKVSTSGKGGNYPSGIFVGTVTESVVNDDAIISTIYVKPVANISSFNYVTVLGREDSK